MAKSITIKDWADAKNHGLLPKSQNVHLEMLGKGHYFDSKLKIYITVESELDDEMW